jgi:hypothetical protein
LHTQLKQLYIMQKTIYYTSASVIEFFHIYRGNSIEGKTLYSILNQFGFNAIGEGFTSLKQAQKVCKELNNESLIEFTQKYNISLNSTHTKNIVEALLYEYVLNVHTQYRTHEIDYLLRYVKNDTLTIEGKYLGPQKSDNANDIILLLTPYCEGLKVSYCNDLNQYGITFKENKYNFFGASTQYIKEII